LRPFVGIFLFASFMMTALGALEPPDPRLAVDLPSAARQWFRNPDGSCVQCSIGMCGVDQNDRKAATLLWNTECGSRERGGSWPGRVADYCRKRGIQAWNITGSTTYDWMRWAVQNQRGAAIGCGTAHFQTLVGWDGNGTAVTSDDRWYVCNNNSPQKIDSYSDSQFRRLHEASGPWVVILSAPPHPARPQYRRWW